MDAKYCFPNEVLEKVFWYLDGISLTNCRMTCRRWNEIISNLECRSLIWKARCLEMNEDILQELLGNKTPDSNYWNEKSKVDNDFWRRVYVKNYKSTYLHKLPCIQKNIFMGEDNQVTCVRITGKVSFPFLFVACKWKCQIFINVRRTLKWFIRNGATFS